MPKEAKRLTLTTTAFKNGKKIPRKFSGEGENISPPLIFSGVPDKVKSFVLICHDPDAPMVKNGLYGFVHWVLYNIPGDRRTLEAGTKDFTKGLNDAKRLGYTGPMPPKRHGKHHYFFVLFALKRTVELKKNLSMRAVLEEIEPYTIGVARLLGTYKRK